MRFKILLVFLIFLFQISSCVKPPYICYDYHCQSIEIKFINQQGQNLIFGPAAQYRLDSIRMLNQINNYNTYNASFQRGFVDSNNIIFHFYTPESKSYIYFNQQTKSDSLEIKWIVKTAKCERGGSLEYNAVDSVKFNNTFIKPANGVYTFVK